MLNYQRVLHNWENRHPSGPSNSYFRVPFWCLLQGKEQPSPTLAVASEWNGEMERVLTYSHISKVSLGSCIHRLKGIRQLFSESVIMVPAISKNTECHSRAVSSLQNIIQNVLKYWTQLHNWTHAFETDHQALYHWQFQDPKLEVLYHMFGHILIFPET